MIYILYLNYLYIIKVINEIYCKIKIVYCRLVDKKKIIDICIF